MKLLPVLLTSLISTSVFAEILEKRPIDFSKFRSSLLENLYSQMEVKHYTDAKEKPNGDPQYTPQMQVRYIVGTVLWQDRLNISATLGVVKEPEKTVLKPRRTNFYYELSLFDWNGVWIDHYTSFWLPQKGKAQGTIGDVGVSGGYSLGSDVKWWVASDISTTLTSREQEVPQDRLLQVTRRDSDEPVLQKNADGQGRLSSGVSYRFLGKGEVGIEGIYDREFKARAFRQTINQQEQDLYEVVEKTTSRMWISYSLQDDVQVRARLYQYFQKHFSKKSEGTQMIAELSVVAKMI